MKEAKVAMLSMLTQRGPAQFAHHSSLKQISSRLKALIIAGLPLESPPQETTGGGPWKKHAFINEIQLRSNMGWMESFFAPRKDHRGWSTPSEAARLFFLLTMLSVGFWAWVNTSGNIVMWIGLTFLVATPLLSIGWWLISMVSARYPAKVLTEAVNNVKPRK